MKALLAIFILCFAVTSGHATTRARKYPLTEERFWLFNGPGGSYGFYQSAELSNEDRPYVSSIIVVANSTFFLPYRVTTIGTVVLIVLAVGTSAFLVRQFVIPREREVHVI